MIKKDYLKELEFPGLLKKGSNGPAVERIQEWLTLNKYYRNNFNYQCSIDGDFGPQTESAVCAFQGAVNALCDGECGKQTWAHLISPMKLAYDSQTVSWFSKDNHEFILRNTILSVAKKHLESVPRELNNKNEGPWVRAYMGGHDGSAWAWCVGSTLSVIDQAMSMFDMKFTDYLPNTYSCDKMGEHAKKQGTLIRNKDLRELTFEELKEKVKPGDIVQVVKTSTDWTHTALIIAVNKDSFETWEGNTNDEGSREGYEVCNRTRNFRKSNLDVIQLGVK